MYIYEYMREFMYECMSECMYVRMYESNDVISPHLLGRLLVMVVICQTLHSSNGY